MLRHRLHSESGIALVMAVGILTVLMATGATLIYYANANTRSAERSVEDERALNIAEAGVNYARSVLYNASNPESSTAVPPGSLTVEGGSVSYTGTYNSVSKIWTLTGTGTYDNPAGGTSLSRTVTTEVQVVTSSGTADPAWFYNYSDATSGCMTIKNNATFNAPIYVRGNLCLPNNAHVTGSSLHVGGTITVANNASVGYSATPVATVNVVGGCTGGSPNPHPCVSGIADRVYDGDGVVTQTPGTLTKPPVDLTYWYQNASPGPRNNCTTGSMPGGFDSGTGGTAVPPNPNRSRPTFTLTPATAYNCQTASGRLTWTPGSPGTLLINGTIYFDGNITLPNNANAVYQGTGTLYASGTITFNNNAKLCGISGCTASWDTNANYLVIVAGAATGTGLTIVNNAVFQGAAYVVSNYNLNNNGAMWGPVIAAQLDLGNNAGAWMPLSGLPPGAPGYTAGVPTLQNVPDSYRSTN
jgi:Tfp pilus assembly protein PilX